MVAGCRSRCADERCWEATRRKRSSSLLEGKELNRANMIVVDPRMTKTAAHATEYVRVRPGTHIATIYGMLWHIFENGWEDKNF
jgi:anaerobic selenocysteine-containing dehydrogenase